MNSRPGIRSQRNHVTPVAGMWDFDGACAVHGTWNRTFTIGIFQWIPTANGKGVKRGKVTKRFLGERGENEIVYAKAEDYCASLEK